MKLPLLEHKSKPWFSKEKVALLSLIGILIVVAAFHDAGRNTEQIEISVGGVTAKGNAILEFYDVNQERAMKKPPQKAANTWYIDQGPISGVMAINHDIIDTSDTKPKADPVEVKNCKIMGIDRATRKIMLQTPEELEPKVGSKITYTKGEAEIIECKKNAPMKVKLADGKEESLEKGTEIQIAYKDMNQADRPDFFIKVLADSGAGGNKCKVKWKELISVSVDNPLLHKWNNVAEPNDWVSDPSDKKGQASIYVSEIRGGATRGIWVEVRLAKDDNVPGIDPKWLIYPLYYECDIKNVPWSGHGHDAGRSKTAQQVIQEANSIIQGLLKESPPKKITLPWTDGDNGRTTKMEQIEKLPKQQARGAKYTDYYPSHKRVD